MNKEQLNKLIETANGHIRQLKSINYDGLDDKITELKSAISEFEEGGKQLLAETDVLQIGIVGQVKAGKSSFLNSLFFNGEDMLPKASTPMTAGLTVMEYSDENVFEVEYFKAEDWAIFTQQDEIYQKIVREVKENNPDAPQSVLNKEINEQAGDKLKAAHEMVSSCSAKAKQKIGASSDHTPFNNIADLQDVLEKYVGAKGELTPVVKSLYIHMNDERLKGLRIVDTPGVNDPVVSRENRTRTFLHSCHGVFLLSASSDFLGQGDINFLNTRIGGSGIGSVVILASKFDSVLQDIGADCKMKQSEPEDLVDVIELQKKKFRRRLREQSEIIDERLRGKMEIDTTSGIGYSIAHKDKNRWNELETNVVERMKLYYPDYFTNDDEIKKTFEALANIEDITEKYLNDVFLVNKDRIISQRITAFFERNGEEVKSIVTGVLKDFNGHRDLLNKTTNEEIERQKEIQRDIFEGLKGTARNVFKEFKEELGVTVSHIHNSLRFSRIDTIPTEEATATISVKGKMWGHNTKQKTIKQVNSYELGRNIENIIDEFGCRWRDEWANIFVQVKDKMAEQLYKSIQESDLKMMSSSFNDRYYRNLVDETIIDLKIGAELDVRDILEQYKSEAFRIANNQYNPQDTYEMSESSAETAIENESKEHMRNLLNELRGCLSNLPQDLQKKTRENLNSSVEVVNKLQTDFVNRITTEGEAYLNKLQEELKEKSKNLELVDSIVSILTQMDNDLGI